MVTRAFGTPAPWGSNTVPVMLPVETDICPTAWGELVSTTPIMNAKTTIQNANRVDTHRHMYTLPPAWILPGVFTPPTGSPCRFAPFAELRLGPRLGTRLKPV